MKPVMSSVDQKYLTYLIGGQFSIKMDIPETSLGDLTQITDALLLTISAQILFTFEDLQPLGLSLFWALRKAVKEVPLKSYKLPHSRIKLVCTQDNSFMSSFDDFPALQNPRDVAKTVRYHGCVNRSLFAIKYSVHVWMQPAGTYVQDSRVALARPLSVHHLSRSRLMNDLCNIFKIHRQKCCLCFNVNLAYSTAFEKMLTLKKMRKNSWRNNVYSLIVFSGY